MKTEAQAASPANTAVQPIEPCEHMTNLVSALSDDSLHGPARWYTQFHVATCPKCRNAVQGMRDLRTRLSALDAGETDTENCPILTNERQAGMAQAMDKIDGGQP